MKRFYVPILGFLVGFAAIAGTGNLPQLNTRVIQLSHVNDIRSALSGDFVPRNSASGTPTDVGANLGSTSPSLYRWNNLIGKNLELIQDLGTNNAVTVTAPSPLPSPYPITLPSSLPPTLSGLTISPTGQMGFLGVLNYVQSSSSGPFGTAGSGVSVTNLSVAITTTGRPAFVSLVPDGGAAPALIGGFASGGGVLDGYLSIFRCVTGSCGSPTELTRHRISFQFDSAAGRQVGIPPGALTYMDPVAAGNYTYIIKATMSLGVEIDVKQCELLVYSP